MLHFVKRTNFGGLSKNHFFTDFVRYPVLNFHCKAMPVRPPLIRQAMAQRLLDSINLTRSNNHRQNSYLK